MVGVYQPRDIGGELGGMIGGGLGKGFGEGMGVLAKRKYAKNQLQNAYDEQEDKNSLLGQTIKGLMPVAAVPGLEGVASEIPRITQKEFSRQGGIPNPIQNPRADIYNKQLQKEKEESIVQEQGKDEDVGSSDIPEKKGKITKNAPNTGSIPYNAPLEIRDILSSFPNYKGNAYKGNPQGSNQNERDEIILGTMRGGGSVEQGERRADVFSDYMKEQHKIYQNINDVVSQDADRLYGESPLKDIFKGSMLKEAENQMEQGLLEPNSLRLAVQRKSKDMEASIDRLRSIEGRSIWGWDEQSRKSKSGNVIQPLIKSGEVQAATQLLMSNNLGKDPKTGQNLKGPDWGPVKATEIVQEQVNPQGVKNLQKFASKLENSSENYFKTAEYYNKKGVSARPYEDQQKALANNVQKLTEFMSDPKKFTDKDSLVLLRSYANDMGVDEKNFNKSLQEARLVRDFSDIQDWEQSQLLPVNIRPSVTELLHGIGSVSGWLTGKK